MEKNKEEDIIHFGNTYAKDPEGFRDIVLRAIEKCRVELSKEMKRGGEIKTLVEGQPVTVTIPDQRKIAIETIKTLKNLLLFHFDDKMEKAILNGDILLKGIDDKYLGIYLIMETDSKAKRQTEQTKMITNTQIGKYILDKIDDKKLEVYRLLFEEMILLFKRQNELSKRRIVID